MIPALSGPDGFSLRYASLELWQPDDWWRLSSPTHQKNSLPEQPDVSLPGR